MLCENAVPDVSWNRKYSREWCNDRSRPKPGIRTVYGGSVRSQNPKTVQSTVSWHLKLNDLMPGPFTIPESPHIQLLGN